MASSEIVTLLFTDLVRSTELAGWLGDDAAEEFRKLHFGLLRSAVGDHGGREVKNLGDGLMAVFASAVEGLGAAVAIQRAVDRHNRGGTGPDFQLRLGIHAGEPVEEDGDYFGTAVTLAKRLCDAAEPGQILATETLMTLVGSRGGHTFRRLGPLRLKGLSEAVPVAEVEWGERPSGRTGPPGGRAGRPRPVERPAALTPPPDSFIGREAEVAMLAERLGRSRLVTVTGPGGVGKTRLSGHVVDAVADRYPDGVWCCALAPLAVDDQVPEAVASALRVERRVGMTVEERLVEFLATKELLLVLDNCEHVIDGTAGLVSAVLGGTAAVGVLATSREPLGLPGEHRVPLEPLVVAADTSDTAGAVALFLDRALAADPRLRVDDDGVEVIGKLCRRLDGLPLAIELAAARVATQTVHEIHRDVTEHLSALAVRRGRPERHRSISALVQWSYELLDEPDRRLFERLAVFAGGWNADAIPSVTGEPERAVLSRLDRLVEQSIVTAHPARQSTRYALLEPVRAYAQDRLETSGRHDEARDAHAAYYVDLTERADAGLRGPDEVHWADRLDQEMDNLRQAHRWLMQRGDGDGALRLAGALIAHGMTIGVSELHSWAEEAAEHFAGSGHDALAVAWATAATGAWQRGDLARAETFAARSLDEAGPGCPGDHLVFQTAAVVELTLGRFDRAEELFRQATERGRESGDDLWRVYAQGASALVLAYTGRFEAARRSADSALEIAMSRGNATMRAWASYYAGEVRLDTHPDEAAALLDRSLTETAGLSCRLLTGAAGLSALSLEVRHGDPRVALARFPGLIEHWERSGAWNGMWLTLRLLIETLHRVDEGAAAAVLYGALVASPTAPRPVGQDAARLSAVLDHLRRELGEESLRRHQERGAGLGDRATVAFALEAIHSIPGSLAVRPPAGR